MRKLATMLAVALVSAGLLSCGGDDDSPEDTAAAQASPKTTPTPPKLPLMDDRAFDPNVRFAASPSGDPAYFISEASASPGKASIEFVNRQSTPHNVVVEGPNGETIARTKPVSEGKASTSAVLKPGVYVVYCSVPGHRKAGMTGHLTVR